jgi:carboxymethylenebutenolidase
VAYRAGLIVTCWQPASRLGKSPRHGEWMDIKIAGGPSINGFVVYPERKDKGPVVIVVHDIGGKNADLKQNTDK